LFYQVEAGNVVDEYEKTDLVQNTLRPELARELRPVLGDLAGRGISYEEITYHADDLCEGLQNRLSEKWTALRGIELVSIDVSATIPDEDLAEIQKYQKMQYYNNTANAAGALVESQAEAMKSAAKNDAGAMMGFMGMNMANQAGGANAQNLFSMAAQQPAAQAPQRVPFAKKEEAGSWTCQCGAVNTGKFCMECGAKKPEAAFVYKCYKCGWEPQDPKNPPKFCPECGDPFNDEDKTTE
jgi:membrane protease subunit (stomatin/prohibitin family)